MAAFENYAAEAAQLEKEIARKGSVLGIDWNDDARVRKIARQALASHDDTVELDYSPASPQGIAEMELLGLAQMMLKVMQAGASEGIMPHGGPVWKSLGIALWEEARVARGYRE